MKRTFIIAEAGVNHNGDLRIAMKLVDVASRAGADAVKFQTFVPELMVSRQAPTAGYQRKRTAKEESQFDMLNRLRLDEAAHRKLISYCRKRGIQFISSPFDLQSVALLQRLQLNVFKIPSGEITNLPYLRKIGSLRKRIIISSGMSRMEEIRTALN